MSASVSCGVDCEEMPRVAARIIHFVISKGWESHACRTVRFDHRRRLAVRRLRERVEFVQLDFDEAAGEGEFASDADRNRNRRRRQGESRDACG